MRPQHPGAEAVDRRDERALGGAGDLDRAELAQPQPDPVAQLGGGLLGERDGEDRRDVDPVVEHRARRSAPPAPTSCRCRRRRRAADRRRDGRSRVAAPRSRRGRSARRGSRILGSGHRDHWLRQIPGYGHPSREQFCGHGVSPPRRSAPASATARSAAPSSSAAELLGLAPVGGHDGGAELDALEEHAAGPQILAPQRLVEAGDRLASQQLADDQHVQRHLQAAVDAPASALVLGPRGAALVVAHHRAAVAVDVDAVDHAPQQHRVVTVAELQRRQRVVPASPKPNRSSSPSGRQSPLPAASCSR